MTCSWRPGDFGLCQDICSRFTFHLQSSWLASQLGSAISQGLQGSQGHKGCKICLLLCHCHCFGPVELQHGYFSCSLTYTSTDETHEFSWTQSRTEFGVNQLLGYWPHVLSNMKQNRNCQEVGKWWQISCWVVVRWLKEITGILVSYRKGSGSLIPSH